MLRLKDSCEICSLTDADILYPTLLDYISPPERHRFFMRGAEQFSDKLLKEVGYYCRLTKDFRERFEIYPGVSEMLEDDQSNVAFAIGSVNIDGESIRIKDCSISLSPLVKGEVHIDLFSRFRIITEESLGSEPILSSAVTDIFDHKRNTVRDRKQDTEYKLLENISQQILASLDGFDYLRFVELLEKKDFGEIIKLTSVINGSITLFTERRVCESCCSVINTFKMIFPDIKLRIVEGFGDFVKYKKAGIEIPKIVQDCSTLRSLIATYTV